MKKNIYFIVHTLGGGGAERVISILANYLVERDYNVTMLITHHGKTAYYIDPRVKMVEREVINEKDGLKQIKFIRSWYKKDKDGIFISFSRRHNLYTLIAAIGTRTKVIISERNYPFCNKKASKKGYYEMETIKKLSKKHQVKAVVFQTEGAKSYYPEKTQNKGVVIPNPIKDNLPDPYEGERTKRIVAVGRITPQKNYNMVIKAFRKFSEKHDDYRLEIYGDGTNKQAYEKMLSEKGLADKIIMHGFSDNLYNDILDARMFVMGSRYEGMSNALIEALALGIPTISTDHPPGGARAVITPYKNGILTKNEDPHDMYKAMCYMAEHEEEAAEMGRNGVSIREQLATDRICAEWEKLFSRI